MPAYEKNDDYMLTLVDCKTGYLEIISLQNIETEIVSETLIAMYSWLRVPEEVTSNLWAQYVLNDVEDVSQLSPIQQSTTISCHPICNRLLDCFNDMLKKML